MNTGQDQEQQRGVVILAVFAILLCLFVGGWLVVLKSEKKPVSTAAAEVVEAGGSAITRSAQNVQRKNDASVLLANTAEYISGHNGQMPHKMIKDLLRGTGYYSAAAIADGDQKPLAADQLRLVTGARCTGSGGAVGGSSRQYVVQYGLEKVDGSFEPTCTDA